MLPKFCDEIDGATGLRVCVDSVVFVAIDAVGSGIEMPPELIGTDVSSIT